MKSKQEKKMNEPRFEIFANADVALFNHTSFNLHAL